MRKQTLSSKWPVRCPPRAVPSRAPTHSACDRAILRKDDRDILAVETVAACRHWLRRALPVRGMPSACLAECRRKWIGNSLGYRSNCAQHGRYQSHCSCSSPQGRNHGHPLALAYPKTPAVRPAHHAPLAAGKYSKANCPTFFRAHRGQPAEDPRAS